MSAVQKLHRSFPWAVIALALPALAVLLALGTWQVQRLAWKEDLIATVESRMDAAPVPVGQVVSGSAELEGIDYRPVTMTGTYVADEVFFEFTTHKGISGWNLFHLLQNGGAEGIDAARYTIINRGFIPYDMRDTWSDVAPLPSGPVKVTSP